MKKSNRGRFLDGPDGVFITGSDFSMDVKSSVPTSYGEIRLERPIPLGERKDPPMMI